MATCEQFEQIGGQLGSQGGVTQRDVMTALAFRASGQAAGARVLDRFSGVLGDFPGVASTFAQDLSAFEPHEYGAALKGSFDQPALDVEVVPMFKVIVPGIAGLSTSALAERPEPVTASRHTPEDVAVMSQVHQFTGLAREGAVQKQPQPEQGTSWNVPIVSLVWVMVERQQLRAARQLLGLLPNGPERQRIARLLRPPRTSRSPRKDSNRTAEYAWLALHGKEHVGKWVAIHGDSLIASADTLKELRMAISHLALATPPLLHYIE